MRRSSATAPDSRAGTVGRLRSWLRTPRYVGLAVYGAVLVGYSATAGLPLDRLGQTGWILAGIVAAQLGRPVREHVRLLVAWLPLLGALLVYDYTRGIADSLGMSVRVSELADAERGLFGGTAPTVWLQERLYDAAEVRWWDVGVSLVYFSHFIVPWVLAAVLYLWDRDWWAGYMRRIILLSYLGLVTYILLPAAPPWYAAEHGALGAPVERAATRGWDLLGLRTASSWLADAQADVNLVAALPSLHAAFAMMIAVALWRAARHPLSRTLLVLFPPAMGFSLVYGGEHYVIDVLLGWVYVAVAVAGARAWERHRRTVRARRQEPDGPAGAGTAGAELGPTPEPERVTQPVAGAPA